MFSFFYFLNRKVRRYVVKYTEKEKSSCFNLVIVCFPFGVLRLPKRLAVLFSTKYPFIIFLTNLLFKMSCVIFLFLFIKGM